MAKRRKNKTDKIKIETFTDATAAIKASDNSLHRHKIRVSDLLIQDGHLMGGGHSFQLTAAGYRRLCESVGAPVGYIMERIDNRLRCELFAYHFRERHLKQILQSRSASQSGTVTVCSRDGKFLSFSRSDLLTLAAADVLDRIAAAGRDVLKDKFDNFKVHRLNLEDEGFSLEIRNPSIAIEPRPNDVINGGVCISHSYSGDQATRVESFILRLICQNGAVRRECVNTAASRIRRTTTTRDDGLEHTLGRVTELATVVFRGLEEKLTSIPKLIENRLNGEGEVKRFIAAQLQEMPRLNSSKLRDRILTAWRSDGAESSEYGVWNALTRVATHASNREVSPSNRSALMRLAGLLATRAVHLCPQCFRAISQA